MLCHYLSNSPNLYNYTALPGQGLFLIQNQYTVWAWILAQAQHILPAVISLDAYQHNNIKISRSRNMHSVLQQNKENVFKAGVPFGIKLWFKMPFLPLHLILPSPQGLILLFPPAILDIPTFTVFTETTLPKRCKFIASAMCPSQAWPLHRPIFFLVVCRDLHKWHTCL